MVNATHESHSCLFDAERIQEKQKYNRGTVIQPNETINTKIVIEYDGEERDGHVLPEEKPPAIPGAAHAFLVHLALGLDCGLTR